MGVSYKRRERRFQAMPKPLSSSQKSLKDALIQKESLGSTQHVVIVMDALKDFTIDPLMWALENIIVGGCTVTLLGIMPWLNIPLSSKTQEVWALELEEVDANERKVDTQLKEVVDICKSFGVVLQKEVVMGFPLKLIAIEKITSLHATWVVFDRYQKTKRQFFAERIPCNIVMMNEDSEADMIRGRPMIDNGVFTPGESPASSIPTPQLIISDQIDT